MFGWITGETLYPFQGAITISPQSLITNDLQINKAYPAIEFLGNESNAVYQETREISGDWWFTSNATYEPAPPATPNQWTQVNAALPSYALVLRANGSMQRLTTPAAATTPITWGTIWTIDALGGNTLTPSTFTTGAQSAFNAAVTWNAPGVQMTAFKENITDTASAASSLMIDLQVGGVSKFSVRKDGTLTVGAISTSLLVGTIPASSITGATFGSALGYAFNPNAPGVTPLVIAGATSQSVDIFDVLLTNGGIKALSASSGGGITIGPGGPAAAWNANNNVLTVASGASAANQGSIVFGNGTTAQTPWIQGNGGSLAVGPSWSSSTQAQFGATTMSWNGVNGMTVAPTINGFNVMGNVPPVYRFNGTNLASTSHIVWDQIIGLAGTTTVTLSGAAAYGVASGYSVLIYDNNTGGIVTAGISQISGTQFSFPSALSHPYNVFIFGF